MKQQGKRMLFHTLSKKKKKKKEKEANGTILNGIISLFFPGACRRQGKKRLLCSPATPLFPSLCPHLPKNTRQNPYPHSPAIMMKKGEGTPYGAAAGVAVQKPPHATLPCTLTRQGRVASLSSCL